MSSMFTWIFTTYLAKIVSTYSMSHNDITIYLFIYLFIYHTIVQMVSMQ